MALDLFLFPFSLPLLLHFNPYLCSEIIQQYHAVHSFVAWKDTLFTPLMPLIECLPSSIAGSSRPPSLLKLLHVLTRFPETISFVESMPAVVSVCIRCIASAAEYPVMSMVMDILMALLDCNAGRCLHAHAQVIFSIFALDFNQSDIIFHLFLRS